MCAELKDDSTHMFHPANRVVVVDDVVILVVHSSGGSVQSGGVAKGAPHACVKGFDADVDSIISSFSGGGRDGAAAGVVPGVGGGGGGGGDELVAELSDSLGNAARYRLAAPQLLVCQAAVVFVFTVPSVTAVSS